MGSMSNKDHWAFLEEMEAPMWVDLTLDVAQSNTQTIDDEWFYTSHLFHQCSSQQLKAAFARSWEDEIGLNLDFLGQSSPNLPNSVSTSRGKDYRSKNWGGGNCNVSPNKPHPVKVFSGKSICMDLGSSEKIKPRKVSMKPNSLWVDSGFREGLKPKLSFISQKQKATSSLKSSLVTERSSTVKRNTLRPLSTSGSKSSSSSVVDKASESSTASTITSESGLRSQQNFLATSSRALDNTSGLLSAVRITLRKSCVTRQASRVEINNNRRQSTMETTTETYNDRKQTTVQTDNDRRESRDRKSSSSKSSVGSSSLPGSSFKSSAFVSIRKKERTPDSRNLARITNATNRVVKVSKSNVSKVSTVQIKEGALNSRRGDTRSVAKSTDKETAKSKIPSQTLRAKSSVPLRAKEQNSSTDAIKAKEKVRVGLNKLVDGGKENTTGKASLSQTCRSRENAIGGTIRGQTKQNASQKVDTRKLAGSKGKISDGREGKSSTLVNQSQRVFFR